MSDNTKEYVYLTLTRCDCGEATINVFSTYGKASQYKLITNRTEMLGAKLIDERNR